MLHPLRAISQSPPAVFRCRVGRTGKHSLWFRHPGFPAERFKSGIKSINIVAEIRADAEETRRLQDMLKGFTVRTRCAGGCLAQVIDVYQVWRGYQGDYMAERWDRACPGKLHHFEIKKMDGGLTMRLLSLSGSSSIPLLKSTKPVMIAIVRRLWHCYRSNV